MKVLIVGLGSIAAKHIAAMCALKQDAQFFAWRSEPDAPAKEGINNLYNFTEVQQHRFDFALISNPTSEHFSVISQLIHLNIPLFIEKPIFSGIGQKEEELIGTLQTKSISTYVACNLRFLEALQFVKKEIVSKRINEVNVYCGSYLPSWRPGIDYKTVYSANKEMGGGVHIDLIHELDYCYWLFGAPDKSSSTFRSVSSLEISAYDYANYQWNYDGFSANIVLNYYRPDAKRTLEIVCEDGTYTVDLLANSVRWNGQEVFTSFQKIADTYYPQMEFFFNNVLTGGEQFNTAAEAYKILDLCLNQS